jgi:hypothetical protein
VRTLAVAILVAVAAVVRADDYEIDSDFPLRVEDATPTDYGEVDVQVSTTYEHTRHGRDLVNVGPRLKWGALPDLDVQVQTPILAGDADRTGSRDLQLRSQWRFLHERGLLPALAVQGELDAPTGVDSVGLDTVLEGIATKTISAEPARDELHLDAYWYHAGAPHMDERKDRYRIVVGWTRRLWPGTLLVADGVREQDRNVGHHRNLLEVGLVQSAGDRLHLAAGVGAGIAEQSPDVIATLAFEYALTQ